MSLPTSPEARSYYRCAKQRFEDAVVLREAKRTTGAVYLAGYSVECILKALILSSTPVRDRTAVLLTFRGGIAHDFEWLRAQYYLNGGARFPQEMNHAFALVTDWTTEFRYTPGSASQEHMHSFLTAVEQILRWADQRM